MRNTDQTDSPPSLNPENRPETPQPETPQPNEPLSEADSEALAEVRREDAADAKEAADGEPFVDPDEEARFREVHGGPSGRLRTPEEAAEEKALTLMDVKDRIGVALQAFRKVTKQSHTVDRLLESLTPNASRPDRLPFTPTTVLQSRNRDDHILHLAGIAIVTWGILMRDEEESTLGIDGLEIVVTRLGDVIRNRNLFKVYPMNPNSSLYTLRLITDQAELNRAAEDQESKRASRLSGDEGGAV